MRALVVYESEFGNTETIARSIADALGPDAEVRLCPVAKAPTAVADVDLLVLGGPTHAFGMSRPNTRRDAARRGGHDPGSGIREWLAALPALPAPIAAATFDTRIDRPAIPGSAAHAAERRLRRLGFWMVQPALSFYVADMDGPLRQGEMDRARRWGEELARLATGDDQPMHG